MFMPKMHLANFTCLFGEKFVMLDLFDEVIYPAFKEERKRSYADADYFLLDTELVKFTDGEVAFIGRHVKDTQVERDQVLEDGKIKKHYAVMDSAPTSFFVLLLSNHKLLYVPEGAGAPSVAQFGTTMATLISKAYADWTKRLYAEINASGRKMTWKQLREVYPPPVLEVTKMATESSVSAFVEKFRTINTVEVRVLNTNHELDNSPIFGEMRDIKDKIHADQVVLKTQKKGEVGLDKGGVTKLISSQAEDGNSQITLRGKGINGDNLVATNENFNASFAIKPLPTEVVSAAVQVYSKLKKQIEIGTVALKSGGEVAARKISELVKRYWS